MDIVCVYTQYIDILCVYTKHTNYRLNLQSLELRRLLADLVWCYKVVFGMVDINTDDFFSYNSSVTTRGHKYKLYKKRTVSNVYGPPSLANVS